MSEANKITTKDTLKTAFPKLNKAIDDAYRAMENSTIATEATSNTLVKMISLQAQLNEMVVEGDSSVEAAQLRVDAEGKAHATAKDRVDSDFQKLQTNIGETEQKLQVESERLNQNIVQTENKVLNDYKNFYLDKASEVYLYDLQMAGDTVNQALAVDEPRQEIYSTQVYNPNDDKVEGFIISRLSMGGQLLDSMIFRYGGHGTTLHLERVGTTMYIYTNGVKVDSSGNKVTQYLCRFPYRAGTTITVDSSSVETLIEFPNSSYYMSPFGDMKNGNIAFRHTDISRGSTNPRTRIELRKLSDVKAGKDNILYTYHFTDEMNASTFQGITIDGTDLYITFGQHADDFHLFHVDMKTGTIVQELKRPLGLNDQGVYEEGFGEPEGLFLYTDPETKHKTLLIVIVTDATGRRRQKLFAMTWNAGVQKFLGLSLERTQKIKLTRDDGKAKRVSSSAKKMADIKEVGWYYLTGADGDSFSDHPFLGRGGVFLQVSPLGSSPWYMQECILVTSGNPERAWRIVNAPSGTSPWRKIVSEEM